MHVQPTRPTGPAGPPPVQTQPQPQDAAPTPARDQDLVLQITDAVVERMRGSLGLPPEEPPVAPLGVDAIRLGAPHLAGGFMHEPEAQPESVAAPSPAGAFASEPAVPDPHPAGSFTGTD